MALQLLRSPPEGTSVPRVCEGRHVSSVGFWLFNSGSASGQLLGTVGSQAPGGSGAGRFQAPGRRRRACPGWTPAPLHGTMTR